MSENAEDNKEWVRETSRWRNARAARGYRERRVAAADDEEVCELAGALREITEGEFVVVVVAVGMLVARDGGGMYASSARRRADCRQLDPACPGFHTLPRTRTGKSRRRSCSAHRCSSTDGVCTSRPMVSTASMTVRQTDADDGGVPTRAPSAGWLAMRS